MYYDALKLGNTFPPTTTEQQSCKYIYTAPDQILRSNEYEVFFSHTAKIETLYIVSEQEIRDIKTINFIFSLVNN